EDVDIGIKLSRIGQIVFCPSARMAHHCAPGGRVSSRIAAEDDLYNRFFVLRRTMGLSGLRALGLVSLFLIVETSSNFFGCLRRIRFGDFLPRLIGRTNALARIIYRSGTQLD